MSRAGSSIGTVLRVGGLHNAQGLISIAWNKDASDPRWADDPEVKEYLAFLRRYAPSVHPNHGFAPDNGLALRKVCARFVELCREMGLLATASVGIDGSKFKAVNNGARTFTRARVERRRAQLEESVARYLSQLDTGDRQDPYLPRGRHHGDGTWIVSKVAFAMF
jgi:hypothetical protein